MTPTRQITLPTYSAAPYPVVALHCSGGSGRQWRGLSAVLAPRPLLAPALYGTQPAASFA
jgi:hypothetical protein